VLRPGGAFVHETGWAQLLAHPLHGWRTLDDTAVRGLLEPAASAGLWTLRRRTARALGARSPSAGTTTGAGFSGRSTAPALVVRVPAIIGDIG
jgi:hypothetical protein